MRKKNIEKIISILQYFKGHWASSSNPNQHLAQTTRNGPSITKKKIPDGPLSIITRNKDEESFFGQIFIFVFVFLASLS